MKSALGPSLTIRVDPRKVMLHAGNPTQRLEHRLGAFGKPGTLVKRMLAYQRPFVSSGDWDLNAIPIEKYEKNRKIADLIANRDDIQSSEWHGTLMTELKASGAATHKTIVMRSEADVDDFIHSYALSLIHSLERDGYDETRSHDVGRAMIGRDGRLIKSGSGNHRFHAARVLGVKPVPLEIDCVHREWLDAAGAGVRGGGLKSLETALRQVEAAHR